MTTNRSRYSGRKRIVIPRTQEEANMINKSKGRSREKRTIQPTEAKDSNKNV